MLRVSLAAAQSKCIRKKVTAATLSFSFHQEYSYGDDDGADDEREGDGLFEPEICQGGTKERLEIDERVGLRSLDTFLGFAIQIISESTGEESHIDDTHVGL